MRHSCHLVRIRCQIAAVEILTVSYSDPRRISVSKGSYLPTVMLQQGIQVPQSALISRASGEFRVSQKNCSMWSGLCGPSRGGRVRAPLRRNRIRRRPASYRASQIGRRLDGRNRARRVARVDDALHGQRSGCRRLRLLRGRGADARR
ncbi:hypothetical protein BURKHO8Y_10237 [Burkholderia sp. 8Y]|nr:hypothetical protein BURKHO8Y_10237 [Burkholderia sp. 8Y]